MFPELNIIKQPDIWNQVPEDEVPLVSVIVTTYNHKDFIGQCLESILSQNTDFNFEIILGEDGSNDGTREICMRISEENQDKVSLILHHRENVIEILGRKTGRFNFTYGLSRARGKYVALCDGDDYWSDMTKLQKQVELMEKNPNVAISAHDVKVLKSGELSAPKGNRPKGEWNTILDLAHANFIHTASCMFRNGVELPGWFLTTSAADYPLHMLNATRGDIHYSTEVMAVYRDHQGGIWSSLQREEVLRRWIHLLLTIQPHFKQDVKGVLTSQIKTLMGQLLKDTHVPIKRMDKEWFENLIEDLEDSNDGGLKKKLIEFVLRNPALDSQMDASYLSKRFKSRELFKALWLKVIG